MPHNSDEDEDEGNRKQVGKNNIGCLLSNIPPHLESGKGEMGEGSERLLNKIQGGLKNA